MPMDALPRVPPDSRRQFLVRALRDAIINGNLKPGERLVEREISERTGVSRGPLREALRQLEQEGLIVTVPYTGTRVTGISQAEIEEILVPIRLVLERFAFRHALSELTEADFDQLRGIVEEMREGARAEDLDNLVQTDLAFHQKVVERAGTHCLQVWLSIVPRVSAHFYRDGYRHASLSEIPREHEELLKVMRGGDMDRILALLDEHIREGVTLGRSDARPESDVG